MIQPIMLALSPFFFGFLALYLGQDISWDLRNYHWYNAYAFLNNRYELDLIPSGPQFFLNPLLDVPFYLLATHLPLRAAFFILGCFQGLNFILIFLTARTCLPCTGRIPKNAVCFALGALGMLSGMGISEIGTMFGDNLVSIGILASVFLVGSRFDRLQSMSWRPVAGCMTCAGVPAGMVMGLKLTMATFCVGLLLALLFTGEGLRRRLVLTFFFGVGITVGFLATYCYWGWFLYTHFGSPFFPYFNNIFHSPYFPPLNKNLFPFRPSQADLVFFPFVMALHPLIVNEIIWQDFRMPVLYALAGIAVCFWIMSKPAEERTSTRYVNYLICMAGMSYLMWLFFFRIYRYLLPLDMIAPLLIVLLAHKLPGSQNRRWLISTYLLVIIVLTISPGDWGRKASWAQRIPDISLPYIPDSSDTMILMAGYDAYAYTIPGFPPQISFVSIDNRGFRPERGYGLNNLIRAKIEGHHGRILLFIPVSQRMLAEKALKYYNLARDGSSCRPIVDKLYDPQLDGISGGMDRDYELCDVKRSTQPAF